MLNKAQINALKPHVIEFEDGSIEGGFTQSEMMTHSNCAEKWYLRYARMLERRGEFKWALHYGSAIHASIEQHIHTKGKRVSWDLPPIPKDIIRTPEMEAKYDYWDKVGNAQVTAYNTFYRNEFKDIEYEGRVEFEPRVNFMGIDLTGKLDALPFVKSRKGVYVMDHKTCSRLNESNMEGWTFRFQFMFYMWIASKMEEFKGLKIKGFMVNAIKKPELRQKVSESSDEFALRVHNDMLARPEEYFYRSIEPMTDGALKDFELNTLAPKVRMMRVALGLEKVSDEIRLAATRAKNTDACFHYYSKCPYFDICKSGPSAGTTSMEVKSTKHDELGASE